MILGSLGRIVELSLHRPYLRKSSQSLHSFLIWVLACFQSCQVFQRRTLTVCFGWQFLIISRGKIFFEFYGFFGLRGLLGVLIIGRLYVTFLPAGLFR